MFLPKVDKEVPIVEEEAARQMHLQFMQEPQYCKLQKAATQAFHASTKKQYVFQL